MIEQLPIIRCQVKCKEHGWFDSPIRFDTPEEYYNKPTWNKNTTCPYGGEMVPCDKDHMRFEYRDGYGKVIYEEGKDAY